MRVTLTILCLACFAAGARGQTLNDQVAKAWKERQDKVQSADFHITTNSYYPKGGYSDYRPPGDTENKPIPAEDIRATRREKYVLDGTRVRVETDGVQWSGRDFRPIQQITTLDGKMKTQLEVGVNPVPRGWLAPENDYFEVKGQNCRPITRCFRGVSQTMRSFMVDDLKPTGTKVAIGGRICEQFIIKRVAGDRTELWLDPAREWVLAREVYIHPGKTHTQLDITYEPHPVCGWIPKTWDFRHTKSDTVQVCVDSFSVSEYTINQAIPESTFSLTFPAGTTVLDTREKGTPPKQYVVTDDTVQTLDAGAGRRPWWHYGAGALAVGLLTLLAYRVWWRRRSRAVPATSTAP